MPKTASKALRKVDPSKGKASVIDPLLVRDIVQGVVREIKGEANGWFGPGQPLAPVAQQTVGRLWDFPTSLNLRSTPRDDSQSSLTFAQLRGLVDACDIMRVCIEKRKDQIEAINWEVVAKKNKTVSDEDLELVTNFMLRPSQELDWNGWLRAMLDDLLVLDAVAIYPRLTRGGQVFSFDLLDAATIKRIVDEGGRMPLPPQPAYQQVLKGLPASNYTSDQLYYFMRNSRTNRLYGYSPVEWVVTTINTAIRRSLHQLQYYTEGNIPEMFASAPEGWTTDHIREFQNYWDSLMEGNTANRRHLKMVPFDTSKVKEAKTLDLKDMFDEWIARILCFALGISPAFLIKDQNRATAETVHEQAIEEGLMPMLKFLKHRFDHLIQRYLGFVDLEFKWNTEEEIDANTQATIDKTYIEAKVLTPDWVREKRFGLKPMTPEEREKAWPTPVPAVPGFAPAGSGAPPKGVAPGVKKPGQEAALTGSGIGKLVISPVINIPERQVKVEVGDVNVTAHVPGGGEE